MSKIIEKSNNIISMSLDEYKIYIEDHTKKVDTRIYLNENNINIAIIGLGQIGIYLYNELKIKKRN